MLRTILESWPLRCLLLSVALLPLCALAAPADISREEVQRLQQGKAPLLVVDVRSPEEYAAGHLPGAMNIPYDQMAVRIDELSAFRDHGQVVLYCRSGRRVEIAAATLEEAGFGNLRHLEGDFPGWQQAGLPVPDCTRC